MKRIIAVISVMAIMAAMMVVMAVPAFATTNPGCSGVLVGNIVSGDKPATAEQPLGGCDDASTPPSWDIQINKK